MKYCRVLQCLNEIVRSGLVSLAFSAQVRYVHCSNIERNNPALSVPESRSDWQINCNNEMSRIIIAANFNSTQQMSQILFPSKLKFSKLKFSNQIQNLHLLFFSWKSMHWKSWGNLSDFCFGRIFAHCASNE